jgi:hypothetical protein
MRRIALSLGCALVALAPLVAMADDQAVIGEPSVFKWGPAPPALPKGAQIAVLYGDPGRRGRSLFGLSSPRATRCLRTATPTMKT